MGYMGNDRRYGRDLSYGYRERGGDDRERGYSRGEDLSYNRDRGYDRGRDLDYGPRSAGRYDRDDRHDRDDRDDERGFFDRAGDEVRSWFGDEEAERRRRQDEIEDEREYRRRQREWGRYGRETSGRDLSYGGRGLDVPAAGYGWSFRDQESRGRDQNHDPHYREWRDRQIEALDRDYHEYRSQNQSKFDNEFGSWRTQRQGQRDALSRVQEHQEVVGSDGGHVGTVDHVRGDHILLTKTDQAAGGHHHSIPSSWVNEVSDKVTLSKTSEEAKKAWKDAERSAIGGNDRDRSGSSGPHNLNRSFSGTY